MDGFEWDAFLSHSSADKPRVARLAERLEAQGLRIWFARDSIDHGQDIVAAIERGLEQSRVLVFCMTRAAFESEWVRLERNTALFRDPQNQQRRFLPIRFDDCAIPAMLRRIQYIDWRDESEEAWQEIQDRLRPRAEPMPEIPPQEWNPFDPFTPALGSGFVGRSAELQRLQTAMELGHSVSVVGDWRIGKTSLLAAFSQRARECGRVVRHVTGEGPEGASLSAFVQAATGKPLIRSETAGGHHEVSADVAADHLNAWAEACQEKGGRPVLVVDESERLIESFEHRFFERIRGMLPRLMVVLSSSRELDLVYEAQSRTSPFSNTLELVRVALLDHQAVEEFSSWGSGMLLPEDVSMIREWAGAHPYFMQLLAKELVTARQEGLSPGPAVDRFCDLAATRLRELWRTLGTRDREELAKLASDQLVTRRPLKRRGLVTEEGKAFGRVLVEWLEEECP